MLRLSSAAPAAVCLSIVTASSFASAQGAPLDPLPPPTSTWGTGTQAAPQPAAPAASTPTSTTLTAPAPANPSTVKLTFESSQQDHAQGATRERTQDDSKLLHGFRLGFGYVANYDKPMESLDGISLKEKIGLKSPAHFLLGYEVMYRVVSQSWLNVLLLGNAMVAGLEQSKVLPTGNLLIGAEINNSFQIGVGANLSPLKGQEAHTIIAAGWTPKVGTLYTPFHVFFIPDVDGAHRLGVTTGVTF
jgi:hypothetical protein